MAGKIKLKIRQDKFEDFLEKLEDLTKISDTVRLKIDSKNILMYSTLGGNIMLAFKNYLIKTDEYFEKPDIEFLMDLIIPNCVKFVKNLDFLKSSDKITMELSYKPSSDDENIMNVRSIQIVGGKLKVNWVTGEHYEMRDINKDVLYKRLDRKNSKWSFSISKKDFIDIKKLSNINSQKIINIGILNGKVILSEVSAWELEIGEIEDRNANLILNKRFLKCINDMDVVEFSIFETFMLVTDDNSNLMLSFEQNFDDGED